MTTEELERLLLPALARLYDYPYLKGHPLAALLLPADGPQDGAALSNALIAAIERLKPKGALPPDARPRRNYEYLRLRYVELASVRDIARALSISERQSQRVHAEAIAALAAELLPRDAAARDTGRPADMAAAAQPVLAVAELARLAAAAGADRVSLREVLAGIADTLGALASAKGAVLDADLPADLPPLAVDRTLLRQGLLNLAVAALEAGAGRVAIAAARSGEDVTVCVASGFLQRGEQAADHCAALRKNRSYRIALQMLGLLARGAIAEESTAGGASVQVVLPATRPVTVLVVDDNEDTLRLFRRYLGGGAYRVTEARSGAAALVLARQLRPDVVVLDVMMPEQDGWETLQRLHNDPETRDCAVIICSVMDQRDLALSLGAVDLLPKPVNRSDLLAAIARCVGMPRAH